MRVKKGVDALKKSKQFQSFSYFDFLEDGDIFPKIDAIF